MEHPLEAQVVDSRHLKLKRPIKIPPGSTVMITIEPTEGIAEEQEWWVIGIYRDDFRIWGYVGGVAAYIPPNPGTSTAIPNEPEWYLLSSQGLKASYGEDEPEYSLAMIKIPNPEYQP